MNSFVDPRSDPDPAQTQSVSRTTDDPGDLDELRNRCREGRLYEVESWIRDGQPLQLAEGRPSGRRRWKSALEIALEDGNHALVLLLLCNGYDPNRERHCPLNQALNDRRLDLLDLLLEWRANPHRVDLHTLFGTYNSNLFERFRELGVDLTSGHALASALGHHTSNKPLFGFAKRHRDKGPKIQRELNIALVHHAGEGNEKGVSLCLWAGANPHAPAPSLRYSDWEDEDEEDGEGEVGFVGFSAVHEACSRGHVGILEQLGPDPDQDDFDSLYCTADRAAVVEFLADIAPPENPDEVIRRQLWWATRDFGHRLSTGRSLRPLQRLFEMGIRWQESSKQEIRNVRAGLLKTSDRKFIKVMKLLAKEDYCSPAVLQELGRTKAIRSRMKEVGFIPPDSEDHNSRARWRRKRPTRFQEVLKKFGVGMRRKSQPESSLPQTVHVGRWEREGNGIRLSREELYDRVWSTPVSKLAEEWGLSGTGLQKACQRLQIPTPPRGYWQKLRAGKKVKRSKLPELPKAQAEEIVIWQR